MSLTKSPEVPLAPGIRSEKGNKIVEIPLFLYGLSVCISMAGMEIFSWLSGIVVVLTLANKAYQERKNTFFKIKIGWPIWALLGVILIGVLTVKTPGIDRLEVFGRIRNLFLIFLLTYGFSLIDHTKLPNVIRGLLGLAGIIAIYAVVQFFTGYDFLRDSERAVQFYGVTESGNEIWRSAGLFSSPMTYGHWAAMVVCIPFAFWVSLSEKTKDNRWLVATVAIAIGLSVITSMTRGAWIAAGAGLATVTLLYNKKLFVYLSLVGFLAGTVFYFTNDQIAERINSLFDINYSSNASRMEIWRVHWEVFRENPWLGVGYGENERIIGTYYDKLGIIEGQIGHAHNTYLQMLAGTGIFGFLSYVLFVGSCLWVSISLWRRLPVRYKWWRSLVLGIIGAQVAIHFGGLTECNFKDGEVNHLFVSLISLVLFIDHKYATQDNGLIEPKT